MKLWGGRFSKPTNELVEEFTESVSYDFQLYRQDIAGSIAHVLMLGKVGVLSEDEARKIADGLREVGGKIEAGKVEFSIADEDIHMNVERQLTEAIGSVAGKLHTARSRNDQVALGIRMYVREHVLQAVENLTALRESLVNQAKDHLETVLPGYTHMQRAQPVLLAHHLLAYVSMFERDVDRLQGSFSRINVSPLGSAAMAGTPFPIDREYVAKLLKFDSPTLNSMDSVSDKDFVLEFHSNSALVMMHLSRLCEELILWSSTEFGFVEIDDAFCTGSSIMPQKKNPDVCELVRGKTGRVYGNLMALLTVTKGLPLTYNRDYQEDREGLIDTTKTLLNSLALYSQMITSSKFNVGRMREAVDRDFSNATDVADYLAAKGLPFREAHEVSGKLVRYCLENDKLLLDLSMEEFSQFSDLFDPDIREALEIQSVVDARKSFGGTATSEVEKQLLISEKSVAQAKKWVNDTRERISLGEEFSWN